MSANTPPVPASVSECRSTVACDLLRDALVTEAQELLTRSTDALEGDDAARFDAIDTQLVELKERRDKFERLERSVSAGGGKPADGALDFQHQRQREVDHANLDRLPSQEIRDGALKVLERSKLDTAQSDHLDKLLRSESDDCDGEVIARRTLLTENPAYRSAFMKIALEQYPHLSPEETAALDAFKRHERHEARAMNITTTTAGGFGVPVLIDPTIMLSDQGSHNFFLDIANVKTITTKDWRGVTAGGVTFAFETESAASDDISPTLAQPVVHAHKAQGTIPFSIEVGMDYPGFAEEMGSVIGEAYNELLVNKFTIGTGSGQPWGIFEACEQATSQVTVTTDGLLGAVDIHKVWGELPQRFRRNASWVMNVDVNNEIRALGDDKLFQQTVNLTRGAVDILMGRPVYESPYAPAFTGTTGAASIAVVGDFSRFVIAQRAGLNVETVQHLVDTTTGLPTGQRAFYAWTRVGSDLVTDNAARMLVNT